MTKNQYAMSITRMEIFEVSNATLQKERNFQIGKSHRKAGLPCMRTDGAYLNGWHSPETDYYYITKHAAHLL